MVDGVDLDTVHVWMMTHVIVLMHVVEHMIYALVQREFYHAGVTEILHCVQLVVHLTIQQHGVKEHQLLPCGLLLIWNF